MAYSNLYLFIHSNKHSANHLFFRLYSLLLLFYRNEVNQKLTFTFYFDIFVDNGFCLLQTIVAKTFGQDLSVNFVSFTLKFSFLSLENT